MDTYVYLPLLASAALAALARPLARGGSPALMTRLLGSVAAVTALLSGFCLVLLSSSLVGQIPLVATYGGWSDRVLTQHDPVERAVAIAATAAVIGMAVACAEFAISRTTQFRHTRHVARGLGVIGDFVVMPDREPIAYVMPGGVVAVSVGMLQSLSRLELRALLAHERAHASHYHHRWRLVIDGCVRINPMLRPVASAVYGLTERWADEVAAEHVGDRRLVASALTRAAQATRGWRASSTRLAFGAWTVTDRIAALQADPPRRSWWRILSLCLIVAAVAIATLRAYNSLDLVYDAAQHAAAINH